MARKSATQKDPISVGELTRSIKSLLGGSFLNVQVLGEISGLKRAASGHIYFSLKDEHALINCVIWRGNAARLKDNLEDGQEVVVTGKLDVYEPRGQYNLVASKVELHGVGSLQKKFEELKDKLFKEGLFDDAHKKPLPFLPTFIGVITSSTGAAVRDIISTVTRRFPSVHILLYPARVQGEGAKEKIAAGINYFNAQYKNNMDLMIVGRGGGSLEDLWAFNEEIVARAIFKSTIPVLSAVGHEVDFSIADFVADMRAATPTAAAEIAMPEYADLIHTLDTHKRSLNNALRRSTDLAHAKLVAIKNSYGFRSMEDQVHAKWQQLDDIAETLGSRMSDYVRSGQEKISLLAARLQELSPLNVLARGYSVASQKNGKAVISIYEVKKGDRLKTRVGDGEIESIVEMVHQDN